MLTSAQRRYLKGLAHHLHPVVMVGDAGLTENVLAEADRALAAHELIKIRVHGDDRQAREEILERVCAETGAQAVAHLGKVLILYRPAPKPHIELP